MDIWTSRFAEQRLHPHFLYLRDTESLAPERGVFESWMACLTDRDGKLVEEFQTTFNSVFWEAYLSAAFTELGLTSCYEHSSPDFVLTGEGVAFTAEATIACAPDKFRPEHLTGLGQIPTTELDMERLIALATIRLSNSISTKHKKICRDYLRLAHVKSLPFLLCVAPFEQPFGFLQNDQALRRVLFAEDPPLHIDNEETGERVILGEVSISSAEKHTGTQIPLGIFLSRDFADISAILFSNCATFGKLRALAPPDERMVRFKSVRYNDEGLKPLLIEKSRSEYHETLLDGLRLYLNPFANIPLNPAPFLNREIVIATYDPAHRIASGYYPDGCLIQRSCLGLLPSDTRKVSAPIPTEHDFPQYTTSSTIEWKERTLMEVPGKVPLHESNHLAHYRGWTVLVAMHSEDRDWMGQAIKGTVRNLQSFVQSNYDGVVANWIIAAGCYPTKEEALEAVVPLIDARIESLGETSFDFRE